MHLLCVCSCILFWFWFVCVSHSLLYTFFPSRLIVVYVFCLVSFFLLFIEFSCILYVFLYFSCLLGFYNNVVRLWLVCVSGNIYFCLSIFRFSTSHQPTKPAISYFRFIRFITDKALTIANRFNIYVCL